MSIVEKANETAKKFKLGGIFKLFYFKIHDIRHAEFGGLEIIMEMTLPHRETGEPGPFFSRSVYGGPMLEWSDRTEEAFKTFLCYCAANMVEHEFYESFQYDGKLFKDPHAKEKR